jgi:predicted enzyme related to lactoylglutathione lyase
MIGQWTTERTASPSTGPVLWIAVDRLGPVLSAVAAHGGTVSAAPRLDQGERWLAEIDDPAGNRIGIFSAARTAESQTLIAVGDVEAASAWYQRLLGFVSDHGGPHYERLLADGNLVLQLHRWDIDHLHGPIGDADAAPGNGVLVWFGEVTDFDGIVRRADEMGTTIVKGPHRNPPAGEGNGPGHRELWLKDLDGYTVVVASPDGEAHQL